MNNLFRSIASRKPAAGVYNGYMVTMREHTGLDPMLTLESSPVPKPSTFALLGLALAPFFGAYRRKLAPGRIPRLRAGLLLSALTTALLSPSAAKAELAYFTGIGDLPGGTFDGQALDISADGSIVVGMGNTEPVMVGVVPSSKQAFLWTRADGIKPIEEFRGESFKISADGSTVIGMKVTPNAPYPHYVPVRWSVDGGFESLPLTRVLDLSQDGSIIVGMKWNDAGPYHEGVAWSESDGLGQRIYGTPTAVSADGSVILVDAPKPHLWTAEREILLAPERGIPPAGSGVIASQLSGNGKVAIGRDNGWGGSGTSGPFWWSEETGLQYFEPLPDGGRWITARGLSFDGTIIFGNESRTVDSELISRAAVWDVVNGSRYFSDVLVNEYGLGGALAGWNLTSARVSSADGRTVVGRGINPEGNVEYWVAFLGTPVPEPSALALVSVAAAAFASRVRSRLPMASCGEPT